MHRYLFTIGLFFALTLCVRAGEQSLLARVTVYWANGGSGSDHWTRKHQASTSVRLRSGHCAVDPRRIPYGSKVVLPDGALVAVDTGKHVRTRRAARLSGRSPAERNAIVIDRFFETKGQALAWARRNPQFMTVRVQSPKQRALSVPLLATQPVTRPPLVPVAKRLAANTPPTTAKSSGRTSPSQFGRRIAGLP